MAQDFIERCPRLLPSNQPRPGWFLVENDLVGDAPRSALIFFDPVIRAFATSSRPDLGLRLDLGS
jgi:hypothetical protein